MVIFTGIKPGDLVALTRADGRRAMAGAAVPTKSGRALCCAGESITALRALIDISSEFPGNDDDTPLVTARHGGRLSIRNLELRLRGITDDAVMMTNRVTINALIDTHRAMDIATRFAWAASWLNHQRGRR